MTAWNYRLSIAVGTIVGCTIAAFTTSELRAVFFFGVAAGAAVMHLLYLFDPTVNR